MTLSGPRRAATISMSSGFRVLSVLVQVPEFWGALRCPMPMFIPVIEDGAPKKRKTMELEGWSLAYRQARRVFRPALYLNLLLRTSRTVDALIMNDYVLQMSVKALYRNEWTTRTWVRNMFAVRAPNVGQTVMFRTAFDMVLARPGGVRGCRRRVLEKKHGGVAIKYH